MEGELDIVARDGLVYDGECAVVACICKLFVRLGVELVALPLLPRWRLSKDFSSLVAIWRMFVVNVALIGAL